MAAGQRKIDNIGNSTKVVVDLMYQFGWNVFKYLCDQLRGFFLSRAQCSLLLFVDSIAGANESQQRTGTQVLRITDHTPRRWGYQWLICSCFDLHQSGASIA